MIVKALPRLPVGSINMLNLIDDFLNRTTMYRLVLYYLIVLISAAAGLSYFHLLPFDSVALILSALFLYFFSGFINDFLARLYHIPVNVESVYITALILALIVAPAKSVTDFFFLGIVAIIAMASKYILNINGKHIFNPAAIAVVIAALFLNQPANWWVGNPYMLPFVIIGGLLVVRKIQRENMVFSFILVAIIPFIGSANTILFHSSLFFFAFVMLTEPLTSPPTKILQIIYGVLIGLLFNPNIHVGSIYSTPELALVAGNIFSYLVSPKEKLLLPLKEKIKVANNTYDFIFPKNNLSFVPGQYMEWTLAHNHIDDRGNRRYFTIASSPTENNIRLGVKFYEPASSYKKALLAMSQSQKIVAGQRTGDFTMPSDRNKKLVFMAGGIGVTPFRSMLKYLIDKNERRDIVVFYSNTNETEIAYKDVFDEAAQKLGVKTHYICTEKAGRINEEVIRQTVPDFSKRLFYLSGPHTMVAGFETLLKQMGIPANKIKTDFFPGYT